MHESDLFAPQGCYACLVNVGATFCVLTLNLEIILLALITYIGDTLRSGSLPCPPPVNTLAFQVDEFLDTTCLLSQRESSHAALRLTEAVTAWMQSFATMYGNLTLSSSEAGMSLPQQIAGGLEAAHRKKVYQMMREDNFLRLAIQYMQYEESML